MSRGVHHRAIWAVVLMLLSSLAHADFKQDYRAGLDAAKKGDWTEVQKRMRAAIAAEPTAKKVRLYGNILDPYVPQYYLGLANAALGDCAAAVAAFNDAASAGLVAGDRQLAQQQAEQRGRCERLLAQADKPSPTAPSEVLAVQAPVNPPVAPAVQTPTQTPQPTAPSTPTPSVVKPQPSVAALSEQRIAPAKALLSRSDSQRVAIQNQLRQAPLNGSGDAKVLSAQLLKLASQQQALLARLERAKLDGNATALAAIEAEAGKLEAELGLLGDRTRSASAGLAQAIEALALDKARKRATAALSSLDQALLAARSAGLGTNALVSDLQGQRSALALAVAGSDRTLIERSLLKLGSSRAQLDSAIAAAPKPAPESLRQLVGLYLSGRYADVAVWNQLDSLPDARARAQARLLRAAAQWRLYVRGGEQDGRLIAAVDSDLREAKRLDRALKPNPQAFSPKLLQRYATL